MPPKSLCTRVSDVNRLGFTQAVPVLWVLNSSVPLPCNRPGRHISDNEYEDDDFPAVGEKIYGKRKAINWPLTGKSRRGDV
jgi:hypothetical protein